MRKRLYLWNNTKFRGLLMNITEAILPDMKSPAVKYSPNYLNSWQFDLRFLTCCDLFNFIEVPMTE